MIKQSKSISIGYIKIFKNEIKIEIIQMLHQVINVLGSMGNPSTSTSHNLLQTQLSPCPTLPPPMILLICSLMCPNCPFMFRIWWSPYYLTTTSLRATCSGDLKICIFSSEGTTYWWEMVIYHLIYPASVFAPVGGRPNPCAYKTWLGYCT